MLYPESFEEKIGFSRIRIMLSDACLCSAGETYVSRIHFSTDIRMLRALLGETGEMMQVMQMDSGFPATDYLDLSPLLNDIRIPGSVVNLEDIFDMKLSFLTLQALKDYFNEERSEKYPALSSLANSFPDLEHINREIARIVNDKGEIRDNASDELSRIRKDTRKLLAQSRERLGQIISRSKQAGWTPPGMDLTFRNGRLVIPVLAAHKRRIKGFVHDASATEQTVFLEPAEVLDINNEIRELEYLEKEEIRRILRKFTDLLRPEIPSLLEAYGILGRFDGIRAKALLAIELQAVVPLMSEGSFIEWYDARHPLLFLSHKRQSKVVIPFNLELREDNRILVISGPNAGGKSVCLKTIGLIQYMLQCGLPVPLRETSETGIFTSLFIDIGDEQSIENDLSTYSSHLRNIRYFIENATGSTLFLIDEFGSGTEPQAGGAIAETALEELNERKAFGAVTTHYTNLKLMAGKTSGLINGAMLFDTKSMKPLYRLSTGKPGTSFAFEIARNTGLSGTFIDRAIEKAGNSQYEFEQQLQEIDNEKVRLLEQATQLKVADEFLSEMIDKYETLFAELKKQKASLTKDARAEARIILDQANKLIENTVREIREAEAESTLVKKLRREFEQKKKEISAEPEKSEAPARKQTAQVKQPGTRVRRIEGLPAVGDKVRIKGQRTVAEVQALERGILTLLAGSISIKVPAEQVEKVEVSGQGSATKTQSPGVRQIAEKVQERLDRFTQLIDIRGLRGDEALTKVEQFIDDAVMLNAGELRILHGKGDGILRRMIRDYLAGRKDVSRFSDEHIERGGHGITVVTVRGS